MQYAKIGQKVRITFEGKTKNKRNQAVNLYKVEVSAAQAENTDPSDAKIADESVPNHKFKSWISEKRIHKKYLENQKE